MNCPQCNAANNQDAVFCKNCGTQLSVIFDVPRAGSNKVVNLFVTYLGMLAFQSIFYLLINKLMFNIKDYGSDRWHTISTISEGAAWLFNVAELTVMFMLIANIKQVNVRTWVIIITIVEIILFIVWHVVPLFQKNLDF